MGEYQKSIPAWSYESCCLEGVKQKGHQRLESCLQSEKGGWEVVISRIKSKDLESGLCP
jgi:hypothetical protein